MGTPDEAGPQSDPLPPGERMNPDVASHHRHVEIVSPLCPDVHVASKYLNICVERGETEIENKVLVVVILFVSKHL